MDVNMEKVRPRTWKQMSALQTFSKNGCPQIINNLLPFNKCVFFVLPFCYMPFLISINCIVCIFMWSIVCRIIINSRSTVFWRETHSTLYDASCTMSYDIFHTTLFIHSTSSEMKFHCYLKLRLWNTRIHECHYSSDSFFIRRTWQYHCQNDSKVSSR